MTTQQTVRQTLVDLTQVAEEAASEIVRLREENSSLRREVAALSANALDDYRHIEGLLRATKRQWVGLTDEEIYEMYNEPRSDAEMLAFARAIETKLKEKNT